MKTYIHVSSKAIRDNRKDGGKRHTIIVRDDLGERQGRRVQVLGPCVFYDTDDTPLAGDIQVVCETEAEIRITE